MSGDVDEFDCGDCGRHIVRIIPTRGPAICAECLYMPGWFNIPQVKAMFDPMDEVRPDLPDVLTRWQAFTGYCRVIWRALVRWHYCSVVHDAENGFCRNCGDRA